MAGNALSGIFQGQNALAQPMGGNAFIPPMTDEQRFQSWYKMWADQLGLAPNPDDPLHFYDYRAAYQSGAMPDASGHWPSQFKLSGHPRTIIDGINTVTGKREFPPLSLEQILSGR